MGVRAHKAVGQPSPCPQLAGLLALGAMVEPLVHPKPGGVTRCEGWRGMTIYTFSKAQAALHYALEAACTRGCVPGCLAVAVRSYMSMLGRLGVGTNANLGTLLLLAPLACTVPGGDASRHARSASRCASSLGGEDARAYYEALEALAPSHLGRYEGPVPGVGSGRYPSTFLEVLWAARWDHVHSELLNGYPKTLEAYEEISERGEGEEELALLVLELIARHGDTLIARRHGWRSMMRSMIEARLALQQARASGTLEAVNRLRREWAGRGWTPGAILDIVAAALGLYYLHGPSRGG